MEHEVMDEVMPVEEELSRREDAEPGKCFTHLLAGQHPISYVILFLTEDGEVVGEYYHAADTQLLEMFYLDLADARTRLVPLLNDMSDIRPRLTAEQEADFLSASTCWICEQEFVIPGEGTDIDYGRSRWIVPGKPVVSPSVRPATWCHVG
jgi:hypothetical protein